MGEGGGVDESGSKREKARGVCSAAGKKQQQLIEGGGKRRIGNMKKRPT